MRDPIFWGGYEGESARDRLGLGMSGNVVEEKQCRHWLSGKKMTRSESGRVLTG